MKVGITYLEESLIHSLLSGNILPGWFIHREPACFTRRKCQGHRKSDKIKDKKLVNMAAYLHILAALCLIYKSEYKNKVNRCIEVT